METALQQIIVHNTGSQVRRKGVTVSLMTIYKVQLYFMPELGATDFCRTLRLQPSCIRDQEANQPWGHHKGSTKDRIYLSSHNRAGRPRNICVFNLEFTYSFLEHHILCWENCQLFIWVREESQGHIKAIHTFWCSLKRWNSTLAKCSQIFFFFLWTWQCFPYFCWETNASVFLTNGSVWLTDASFQIKAY